MMSVGGTSPPVKRGVVAMIVIWQGRGLVALVVPFFMLLGVEILVSLVFGVSFWTQNLGGMLTIVLLASAGIVFGLDRRWTDPGRVLVDEATGQKVILRRRHTLFFVPLKYWSIILLAGAVLSLVSAIRNGNL